MELKIDRLTAEQCRLLDCLWSCATEEEFMEWFDTLSYRTKQEVETLLELLRYEMIETKLEMNSLSEAAAYIDNIRLLERFITLKQENSELGIFQ